MIILLQIFWVTSSAPVNMRGFLIAGVVLRWILNRKLALFRAIILTNRVFTVGLILNMLALLDVLVGFSPKAIRSLLVDVVLMAVSNILIFIIWYWIIDPPGIGEDQCLQDPWDFLFPQWANIIPHYESWLPRYTDYLYLAFTTSFAFSPTDTVPLTRRAKLLMFLQSANRLLP